MHNVDYMETQHFLKSTLRKKIIMMILDRMKTLFIWKTNLHDWVLSLAKPI